jgi:hypothetical protein
VYSNQVTPTDTIVDTGGYMVNFTYSGDNGQFSENGTLGSIEVIFRQRFVTVNNIGGTTNVPFIDERSEPISIVLEIPSLNDLTFGLSSAISSNFQFFPSTVTYPNFSGPSHSAHFRLFFDTSRVLQLDSA